MDRADPGCRLALDRIGPGLAERLATGHIAAQLLGRNRGELNLRNIQHRTAPVGRSHRDRRDDAMAAPGQQAQRCESIFGIDRFAQDELVKRHGGVRAQHRSGGQTSRCQAQQRRIELGFGDARDIGFGQLARQQSFQRFGIFVSTGQQQLEAHAQLVEQLAPARALRSEVDEFRGHRLTHGDRGVRS